MIKRRKEIKEEKGKLERKKDQKRNKERRNR